MAFPRQPAFPWLSEKITMKTIKLLSVIICAMAMLGGRAIAADEKKPCCEATAEAGKKCQHKCCQKQAEKGKVCKRCHKQEEKK